MGNLDIDWWYWLIVGSVAFMVLLAALLWRRREMPGAVPLALQALLTGALIVAIGADTAETDPAARELWFLARDALIIPGGIFVLWFALEYASLQRYLSRTVAWALAAPVLLHLLLYLPDGGRLLWSRLWWDGEVRGVLAPLGIVFTLYAFFLFVLATLILVLLFVRSPEHRRPVALILGAHVVVRVVYPLTVLKLVELPNAANILALDFAALVYALALLRFRLFDLVPAARQTIIERMPDAMFVLDAHGRIADLNAAARRILGIGDKVPAGTPIDAFVPRNPALADALGRPPGRPAEIVLGTGDGERVAQVTTIELTDWQGASIGRLAQVHDITSLRAAEYRLVERERALAAATERERLARDLHDSIGQVLAFVGLQTAAIRKLARDERLGEVDQRLDRLAMIATDAHSKLRQTIATLSRPSGERSEAVAALGTRLEAAERDYGVTTSLMIAPDVQGSQLPPKVAAQLLHIVDEAVTNAVRHGHARHAHVSLELERGYLSLSIEDDGSGFDVAAQVSPADGGYGLRFMGERATELGGNLEIESMPGRGTRVTARIPIQEKLGAVLV